MSRPPDLTREERAAAAARGVAARQLRAQIRAGLRDGSVELVDVLDMARRGDSRASILARMKVSDLMRSYRGIGPVRAGVLMERLHIAANRRVGGLGPHQSEALMAALSTRRPAPREGA